MVRWLYYLIFLWKSWWSICFNHSLVIIWHIWGATHHAKEDSKEEVAFAVSWVGWVSFQYEDIFLSMVIRCGTVWAALVIFNQFATVKSLSFLDFIFLFSIIGIIFSHKCFKWVFFIFIFWKFTHCIIIFFSLDNVGIFLSVIFWFFIVGIFKSTVDFL